jgi:hypothetical protein
MLATSVVADNPLFRGPCFTGHFLALLRCKITQVHTTGGSDSFYEPYPDAFLEALLPCE